MSLWEILGKVRLRSPSEDDSLIFFCLRNVAVASSTNIFVPESQFIPSNSFASMMDGLPVPWYSSTGAETLSPGV